jgi:hypothetical protein
VGVPLHEKRLSVRLRLLPLMTEFTHMAIAEDSLRTLRLFNTFLMQEQKRSAFPPTISSTLLEEWILTALPT